MILVTGFGPYQESTNASGVLVESLKENLTKELLPLREKLVFEVITCDDASRETEHLTLEAQLSEVVTFLSRWARAPAQRGSTRRKGRARDAQAFVLRRTSRAGALEAHIP